jgi:Phospholipase_D-nuclease N-terminal
VLVAVSSTLAGFVLVPLVIVWVIAVVDIFRRPVETRTKISWIVIVLLLPFLGAILYFALRTPSKEEGVLRHEAAADLHGARTGGGVGSPPPPID